MIPIGKRVTLWACLLLLVLSLQATAQTTRQQAEAEVVKARELLRQGHYDSAVVGYQKAFEIDPGYVEAYSELGKLMLEKRNFAYAIKMYAKLVELEPQNAEWDKILFGLYDSYEMDTEAIASGERLIRHGEADTPTLKRLAELYKDSNRTSNQIETLELYAQSTEVDAKFWEELGRLYSSERRYDDAINAAEKALEMEPNKKHKVALALAHIDQRNLDKAETIFDELQAENPDDPGVKGHLAKLYSAQGDRWLENERGYTAGKFYRKAKELTEGSDVPEPEALPPSWNNQRNFYNNLRQNSIGGSLDERIRLANVLMRPSVDSNNDFGRQATNDYFQSINTVRAPIGGTELDLRLRYAHYDVSSEVGDADADFLYAGFRYNIDRNWSVEAYGAPLGLYDVEFVTQADNFAGGIRRSRRMWTQTPLAIDRNLKYDSTGLFADWAISDRWSIAGDIDFQSFDDGVDQTIYNIGPTYLLLNDPGRRRWGISYVYSGQTNTRLVNPNLRFAPRALNANTIGTEWLDVVNDVFRYRLGYFHSFINDGTEADSWLIGTDFKLGDGSFLGLEYNQGSLTQGGIPGNIQTVDNDNYNVRADLRVTF